MEQGSYWTDVAFLTLQHQPELQALLSLLPSKQDMQTLANDLKTTYRQDLRVVKSDISAASEQWLISVLQASSAAQSFQQKNLSAHLDDLENRNRRNNVRLRVLLELVRTQDLMPMLFNSLLGNPEDTSIATDVTMLASTMQQNLSSPLTVAFPKS